MILDDLLVELVVKVQLHNGQDTVQTVLAPPGNMREWLSISRIVRNIELGKATRKEILRYESAINDLFSQTCLHPRGFYSVGMIQGIEQKVSNYKLLQLHNQDVDISFFPGAAKKYLQHYHPELFIVEEK